MARAALAPSLALTFTALVAVDAHALPDGPGLFCSVYEGTTHCTGSVVSCTQCHDGPPVLNPYGMSVGNELWANPAYNFDRASYVANLPSALAAVEAQDSDADGVSNLEEIVVGTWAGDVASSYVPSPAPSGLENPHFKVGDYDERFALKRALISYCGRSPSYDEMSALSQAADPRAYIHARVDACLASDYWAEEALHRMADEKIRPLKAVGKDGDIILADYEWDYRLFSYVLRDGRDARELLLADYHVDEGDEIVEGTIARVPGSLLGTPIRVGSGQPLEPARRAGMITTQWFFVVNTMFSPLPRTTAAQAYRSYLGLDIAKGEGILPVEGEPRDVDAKGVQNLTCAACHSTLDPLAYAFSSYNGIEISVFGNPTGQYEEDRTPWGADGVFMGEPVNDLLSWANKAASSTAFKRTLVDMFYEQALGHELNARDVDEHAALIGTVATDAYSANALIHRLIDTMAFGAP